MFLKVARRDGVCGLVAMALIGAVAPPDRRAAVVAGMAGGALVDSDKPFTYFFGFDPFPGSIQRFHARIQNEAPHRMPHEVGLAAFLAILVGFALRAN